MPHDVRMPDGTIIRNVPDGTTKADLQRRYQAHAQKTGQDNRPTSFWQGVGEEASRIANRGTDFLESINPVAQASKFLTRQFGFDQDKAKAKIREHGQGLFAASPNRGSTAGKIAGGVLATAPTMFLPGGVLVQGAAGGALASDRNDLPGILRDATVGAVAGKAGEQIGKHIIAPVAERIGRTAPARAISKAVVDTANRVLPNVPVRQLPLPQITKSDRIISKAAPQMGEVQQNLADAARLNLPYALADASPELRALAGSVSRKSQEGAALAERTFAPRARGQADRAVTAIDDLLAPITNIRQRGADLIEAGKPVYQPLYDRAYSAPAISSPKIEQVLRTPAGHEAIGRANTIAANEFRDPKALGFAVDDLGRPVLNPVPSGQMDALDTARQGWDAANAAYEAALRKQQASLSPAMFAKEVAAAEDALTRANAQLDGAKAAMQAAPRSSDIQGQRAYTTQSLDYVKRGIDDILEPQRSQITGKLNLDESGRAINGVKNALIQEVDNLNPAYAEARSAYGKFAKQAEALNTGHDVLPRTNVPERDFNAIVDRSQAYDAALPGDFAEQTTFPELQRGYATAMADKVDQMRLSGNPYEAIYGSPLQQGKVGRLFPEGSDDFGRLYDLESQMSKTAYETLGGSPTQRRAMADQLFDSKVAGMGDAAFDLATGNPLSAGIKAARQYVTDTARTQGEKRASQLAPTLFDTSNPKAMADYISDIMRKQAEMSQRIQAYQKAGSLLGLPAAGGTVAMLGSQ